MDPRPLATTAPAATAVDPQSVAAAAAGDDAACTSFWLRHRRAVRLSLWRRWNHGPFRSLVDDGCQEVFLECFRPGGALARFDALRAPHGIAGFLGGVVRNVALRLERAQARDFVHRRRLRLAFVQPADPEAGAAMDRETTHAAVERAFALLAREDEPAHAGHSMRDLLRAHLEQGLPVREIARAWRQKAARVHELRRRACRRFRACLLQVLHDHAAVPGNAREASSLLRASPSWRH